MAGEVGGGGLFERDVYLCRKMARELRRSGVCEMEIRAKEKENNRTETTCAENVLGEIGPTPLKYKTWKRI